MDKVFIFRYQYTTGRVELKEVQRLFSKSFLYQ